MQVARVQLIKDMQVELRELLILRTLLPVEVEVQVDQDRHLLLV
jgi:hypothetical protein